MKRARASSRLGTSMHLSEECWRLEYSSQLLTRNVNRSQSSTALEKTCSLAVVWHVPLDMEQPPPQGLAAVHCCLPERQGCSPTLPSVRAELCQDLAKTPHQVLSAAAELKRQCRRRLLRTGWRRRTQLPRAGAVSPGPHSGLLHSCCPAQLIKCTRHQARRDQNLLQTKSTRQRRRGLALTHDATGGAIGAWLPTVALQLLGSAEIAAGLRLSSASGRVLVRGCRCLRYAALHGRRSVECEGKTDQSCVELSECSSDDPDCVEQRGGSRTVSV